MTTSASNGHDVELLWEDETLPDAPQVMTNAAILREVRRLSRSMEALSRVIEERMPASTPPRSLRRLVPWVQAAVGAVLLVAMALWWSRQ